MEDGNVEEEAVVDFREYVQGLAAEELEVDLILGGDEGTECTYSQGYKNRQAIFACRTCTPDGNAGFCTACSLSCHEGHDVLELWTRRQFRCDCGNSKFGVGICRLQANKEPENSCNIYNQNYKGVYCICKRPHPDPDLPEQSEMLQCCICEDWFHEHHLGLPPSLQEYEATGKRKREEAIAQSEGAESNFMQKMGHIEQIEILHGLNEMASGLRTFLAPFGETGKTVTSADIHEFFEKLNQKRHRHI
jgi:E3 ubiquitin-protein ligase UBR7